LFQSWDSEIGGINLQGEATQEGIGERGKGISFKTTNCNDAGKEEEGHSRHNVSLPGRDFEASNTITFVSSGEALIVKRKSSFTTKITPELLCSLAPSTFFDFRTHIFFFFPLTFWLHLIALCLQMTCFMTTITSK
jgi:hypothetical protein